MSGIKLETSLGEIAGIGPTFLTRLEKLGLITVGNLLFHFPARYEDFSHVYSIAELEPGQHATIRGIVQSIDVRRSFRRRMTIIEAHIADETGEIHAVWYNQPYIQNVLRVGRETNFAGKVSVSDGELYLSSPTYELVGKKSTTTHTARLVPVYPETRGLTSKGLRFLIQPILKNLDPLPEFLPPLILNTYDLPEINRALRAVHFPPKIEDAEHAKKRFAFEDLFLLHLYNLEQKLILEKEKAPIIPSDIEFVKKILATLPFELTISQKKSLWDIVQDLEKSSPMNRLLQGDVGSGKTVVAAIAALLSARHNFQTAFMAPTEVLARQHFETFKKLISRIEKQVKIPLPSVGFVSGSSRHVFFGTGLEASSSKSEFHKKIEEGKIMIAIGTHALIAKRTAANTKKSIVFKNLGFVVIDEQHRFGVHQRALLARNANDTNARELHENKEGDQSVIIDKELSYKLNGIFFKTQQDLGRFARERQYADLVEKKLKEVGITHRREKALAVADRKSNFADFIIEDRILVELKAKPYLTKDDYIQTMRYLQSSNMHLGLLVNFRQEYLKPKRILNSKFASFASHSRDSHRLVPHFLSMSATPIPRTLMLTIFGDLDISLINELPMGRKEIATKIVAPNDRPKAYKFIREEVHRGRQAFVICPRITAPEENEESLSARARFQEKLDVKSVEEEYKKLSKKIFPDLRTAMLHGQLHSKEKTTIMARFKNREIDILVSTSVIEVGVDVPNATIMMIEGSEHFGLAQLYQFRGRVGRGEHQSHCFLFTESSSRATAERLKAIMQAKNGFELAEKDLEIRGPGEFLGQAQTGLPDLAMQGLKNMELIRESREAAMGIVRENNGLKKYPLLREKLSQFQKQIHLE